MIKTDGRDLNLLEPGDVLGKVWDPDTRKNSCHCAFMAYVTGTNGDDIAIPTVHVVAHDLQPGDIVRDKYECEEEGDCHCDYIFVVERPSES